MSQFSTRGRKRTWSFENENDIPSSAEKTLRQNNIGHIHPPLQPLGGVQPLGTNKAYNINGPNSGLINGISPNHKQSYGASPNYKNLSPNYKHFYGTSPSKASYSKPPQRTPGSNCSSRTPASNCSPAKIISPYKAAAQVGNQISPMKNKIVTPMSAAAIAGTPGSTTPLGMLNNGTPINNGTPAPSILLSGRPTPLSSVPSSGVTSPLENTSSINSLATNDFGENLSRTQSSQQRSPVDEAASDFQPDPWSITNHIMKRMASKETANTGYPSRKKKTYAMSSNDFENFGTGAVTSMNNRDSATNFGPTAENMRFENEKARNLAPEVSHPISPPSGNVVQTRLGSSTAPFEVNEESGKQQAKDTSEDKKQRKRPFIARIPRLTSVLHEVMFVGLMLIFIGLCAAKFVYWLHGWGSLGGWDNHEFTEDEIRGILANHGMDYDAILKEVNSRGGLNFMGLKRK